VGGVFLGLVWLPGEAAGRWRNLWLPAAVAAGAGFFGILFMFAPALVPHMVQDGMFTLSAIVIRCCAGIGFLAAALAFFTRLRKTQAIDDIMFGTLCLLFAMAGFTFPLSQMWNVSWWLWHAFRFAGSLAAIGYILILYRRSRNRIAEINRDLADRVAEAERLHAALQQEAAQRQQAMQSLAESEAKYRSLYESSKDGIVFTDMHGHILDANQAYLEMVGYTMNEVTSLTYQRLTPAKWREMEEDIVEHQILARGYSDEYEKEYIRKDGTVFPISLRAWLITDDTGKPIGLWAIVRDVADRKRAEARLRDVAADLKCSNDELSQFAYVVSHDLKAPLRGIASVAAWMAEDYRDRLDDKGRQYLDMLVGRAQRLSDMIDGILRYSRAGRGGSERGLVDCEATIRKVVDLLAPPDTIAVRIEGSLPQVVYERTQLEQVFQNLIRNGIKHRDRPEGEVVVSCRPASEGWEFSVQDDGPGIAKEHFERVFELFQTLKPHDDGDGAGVGLAVTRRIVERHGGTIHVESEVGQGSRFVFTIPNGNKAGEP
jgi:PAS domain S-box-containing protein